MPVTAARGVLLSTVLAALLLCAGAAPAQVPVPRLEARVTDLAATLNAGQRAALEQKLAALEARKGSQVAVLIVPTTRPETLEQYAIRVFDQWKLGRKGVDDGVLLLVARNDRRLRIEVGYGLEGAIPDAIAKRIIEEEIVPRFKEGDFHGGIMAGADRIIRLVGGEPMPPPARGAPAVSMPDSFGLLFAGLIVVLTVGGLLQAVFGRLPGAGIVGVSAGVVAYAMAGLVAALIIGAIAFFISLFAVGTRGYGGRWSSGSYSGGGWSSGGGGFSGGGFSGGGGSSGGGGASGSW